MVLYLTSYEKLYLVIKIFLILINIRIFLSELYYFIPLFKYVLDFFKYSISEKQLLLTGSK